MNMGLEKQPRITKPILSIRDVSYSYSGQSENRPAVDRISLTILKGQTLGIVGESGSGKTTLAKLIMHCMKPDTGEIQLQGENIYQLRRKELKQQRKTFQMVFQHSTALNPRRTIGKSVMEPLRIHRIGAEKERKRIAMEWLSNVGIDPVQYFHTFPSSLSGGQLQLVAIARALVLEPKLLVCDEPVSALDVSIQAQILCLLKRLKDRLGLTLVFISHDLEVVNQICDQITVMYKGHICEAGPTKNIFSTPMHPYTQELLNAVLTTKTIKRMPMVSLKGSTDLNCKNSFGCLFAERCSKVMVNCRQQAPGLYKYQLDHQVKCHLIKK